MPEIRRLELDLSLEDFAGISEGFSVEDSHAAIAYINALTSDTEILPLFDPVNQREKRTPDFYKERGYDILYGIVQFGNEWSDRRRSLPFAFPLNTESFKYATHVRARKK